MLTGGLGATWDPFDECFFLQMCPVVRTLFVTSRRKDLSWNCKSLEVCECEPARVFVFFLVTCSDPCFTCIYLV